MKGYTKEERDEIKKIRLNQEVVTNQGYVAKCINYNNAHDIIIEFQDKYKARVHTSWQMFQQGKTLNPYHPKRHGEIKGNKYPSVINGFFVKEYILWENMIIRCCDKKEKEKSKNHSYQNVICCDEWLNYENFYEWLHSQSNFDKWYEGKRWAVDKDIFVKRNKIYSPENCCLVSQNVNCLFLKREAERGIYPIGVSYKENEGFVAACNNPLTNRREELGCYSTPEKAFVAYKNYKEDIIKQVAKIEYNKGNITKECYEAMLNYMVEIND